MADINRVTLLGRLGADPEVRKTQSGDSIVNMRMATGERWTDKATGEKKERTEWHTVVVFGPAASIAERFLKKGSRLLVEGALRTRKWQDKEGNDRYSTEVVLSGYDARIVLLDAPSGDGAGKADAQANAYGDMPKSNAPIDDEIPF